ncbi:MAG TPA: aconitase X catalytic domain-containing protein, partial [Candidatus Micrarchaeota archaeon]|nr:aconitase X catalytic domain-containing protein [Candidatus Micrarchaeota archaeon]
MELTSEEKDILAGRQGNAAQKSMEILLALGTIFGAKRLVPVKSVQIAGVSYDNLGDAGLEYLESLSRDGKVAVKTTLNPAGMDLENYKSLGISEGFAQKQIKVIGAFTKMGIEASCTCTPYYIGNKPGLGEHVAWSESSAVVYANSVLGARTNREGGPSALAAAICGRTPLYGMHLDENRRAQVVVKVAYPIKTTAQFGALGKAIGEKIGNKIPLITGVKQPGGECLKSLSASIATYGGTSMFHMEGVTPGKTSIPQEEITITRGDIDFALASMNDTGAEPDLIALGCPHLSLDEMKKISSVFAGKKVAVETWLCVSRGIYGQAVKLGIAKAITDSGAKIACDTCMVVAP